MKFFKIDPTPGLRPNLMYGLKQYFKPYYVIT